MGELHHHLADLYPGMGFMTTELQTVAEPDDQMALVDDGEIAERHPAKVDPKTSKGIWIGIIAILAIVIGMGGMKS